MTELLKARGLTKSFGNIRAVDGINLTVRAGERVALLGPNGAGKTTTLLMLLGAITPDEGSVELIGARLPKGRSKAMEQVGFAAGYLPLPDRLKVREALTVFAKLYGIEDPSTQIAETLSHFGITHLAERMGTKLSSGQRTLVGVVKAVLHRPKLLILDEPTASLDPDIVSRVRLGLLDLNKTHNVALLVTSHNMVEVERLCERVVFISRGRIVADDTPANVASSFGHDDLENVFLSLADEQRDES